MGLLDAASQPVQPAQMPQQMMAPPEQPPVGGQPPTGGPPGEAMPEMSPEARQQFELIINQATDYIMLDESMDSLVALSKQSPAEGVANLATTVLRGIYEAASNAGKEIAPEILSMASGQVAIIFSSILANEKVIEVGQIAAVAEDAYKIALEKHNAGIGTQQPGIAPTDQGV